MSKIVFGFDKIKEDGDPIDNCINYDFNGWKICDTEEIILGMVGKSDMIIWSNQKDNGLIY